MLPELFHDHLKGHHCLRVGAVANLRGAGVGFPGEFLGQKIQALTLGAGFLQAGQERGAVGDKAIELFTNIGLLGQQCQLLGQALLREVEAEGLGALLKFGPQLLLKPVLHGAEHVHEVF